MKNPLKAFNKIVQVPKHAKVSGTITFEKHVVIRGDVFGDVYCIYDKNPEIDPVTFDSSKTKITVEKTGYVDGTLCAARVIIRGKVMGEITATKSLFIAQGAHINGKTFDSDTVFERHAYVQGNTIKLS